MGGYWDAYSAYLMVDSRVEYLVCWLVASTAVKMVAELAEPLVD